MELTIVRHDLGLTWTVREAMARSSHALLHEERVWLIDPVDDPALIDPVRDLGKPVAVLQLLDRHNRDCERVARDTGVPHLRLPAPGPLADSPLHVLPVVRRRRWQEVALWWPERRGLVVAEALGTTPLFTLGRGPLGLHPVLRLAPPRRLAGFAAAHLLVGHGPPLEGAQTSDAIERAFGRPLSGLRPPAFPARGEPAPATV